jgi:hypothetical protein
MRIKTLARAVTACLLAAFSTCRQSDTGRSAPARAVKPSQDLPYVQSLAASFTERDDAVRVNLELSLFNPTFARGEKTIDLQIPGTAVVDQLGLWVQGRYMEGEIAPRGQAQRVFEESAGRALRPGGRDPALLTWSRDDRCRVRVVPIMPRSVTRLLLSYIVPLPPEGEVRIPSPLPADQLADLRSSVAEEADLIVLTAQTLDEVEQRRWQVRLRDELGVDIRLSFRTDPSLIAGVEMRFPHAVIAHSWRETLEAARQDMIDHARSF